MKPVLAITLAALCLVAAAVHAASPPPKDVSSLLAPIIQKYDIPGMAAAVVRDGELVALGVAGVRTRGKPERIAAADRFHIGSDTKAMTAMLCGILVDEGKLKWNQTLGETFPELKKSMHPQYQSVTLEQLLTHRAGAPGDLTKDALWAKLWQYKGTPTGLYIYKMMDPTLINNSLGTTTRCLPLMRYAEILLNFAEATNEASGPTSEVYQSIEAIRQRAGLRPYQLPTGLTQDQMREVIHTERRLELAYEGFRFFDVRRWLVAEQTDNLQMHGMEVDRGATVVYKPFNVRKHQFTKAMYLWPIPLKEIAKSPELQQNPLY